MKRVTFSSIKRDMKECNLTNVRLTQNITLVKENLNESLVKYMEKFCSHIDKINEDMKGLSTKTAKEELLEFSNSVDSYTNLCDKLCYYSDFISESVSDYNKILKNNSIINESVSSDNIHNINKACAQGKAVSNRLINTLKSFKL